jgi:DNA-binding NtrC family response regulator
MRQAQVLVYEADGRLAALLAESSRRRAFRLRELRQPRACLACLRRSGPGVLVLKLGRDLERELALLEHVTTLFPETAAIVVNDTANTALAALCWDLGAYYVLSVPQPIEILAELVQLALPAAVTRDADA